MVIDTSAIAAILFNEPERRRFIELIGVAPRRLLSAASRVEATLVVEARKNEAGRADLEQFLAEATVEIVPITADQFEPACAAWRRFGKGRHVAALNFGDCFSYALAKATGEPLLFKGDDLAQTDIAVAA